MSLIGSVGKVATVLIWTAALLVLLPLVGLVVLIAFLVSQRPQQVTEEAPEPHIRSRIVRHTAAPGVS